jgi:hypothetical protein
LAANSSPDENSTSRGNEITRIYDLSQQSDYTIQISQPASDKRDAEVIQSNTVKLTVTEDDSVIEKARPPFKLEISAYSDGKFATTTGGLIVKIGAEVGINIFKANTSLHREEDCVIVENPTTGLDEKYQYDVRDSSGNPVRKRAIDRPEPFITPSTPCTIKPGESQGSDSNTITRLYDLRNPGKYTIQVSQPISRKIEDGVVKSNAITVTVEP